MYKHFVPPIMILTFAIPIGVLANEKKQNVHEKPSTKSLEAAQVGITLPPLPRQSFESEMVSMYFNNASQKTHRTNGFRVVISAAVH